MKTTKLTRILSLILAVLLTFTGWQGMALADESDEPAYEATDSYVINYARTDLGDYEAQAPYLYASPHTGRMGIRNLETGEMEKWWITSQQVYNLINTTKLEQGGEGAYASIEAYCTDACSNASQGHIYRRSNLEDCSFYDDVTAGKIRAIFLNSFPYVKDLATIESAVNDWLTAADDTAESVATISGLTGAEAITATQIAIWMTAGGDDVELGSSYYGTENYTAGSLADDVVYIQDSWVDCTEAARDTTGSNIQGLFRYLMALEPMGPAERTISDTAFIRTDMEIVPTEESDAYTVTVTAVVDAVINPADHLVLTAILGDQNTSVTMTGGENTYVLVFHDVTDPDTVTLEINGYQTVADVFLFDANGDRSDSQSMIGYDNSQLPVHAETTVEPDRIIQFHKTTPIQDQTDQGEYPISSRIPLENIEFDIYYLCTLEEYTADPAHYPEQPSADLVSDLEPIATLRTDAAGNATYNLTENGHPDGLYLVIERENPAVVAPAAPFYVAIPMTDQSGENQIYTICIEPKNTVVTGPVIHKDITRIDQNSDTFDIDEIHTWIIRTTIPADLSNAADVHMAARMEYVISDTLDYRLNYHGNVMLKLDLADTGAGEEAFTLLPEHYTIDSATTEDEAGHQVVRITVALTPEGMQYIAAAIEDQDPALYELRTYFDAAVNQNAALTEDIPNQATLDYTNSVGFHFDADSDIPVVYTGGLSLLKYDAHDSQKLLSGAVFKMARLATGAEIAAGISQQLIINGQSMEVIYVDFYTDAQLTEKADRAITDVEGKAVLYGLSYGEYYLVEIKAPDGYNLLSNPLKVTINDESHTDDAAIRIANSNQFRLPDTGDSGTAVFTWAGSLLILSAGAILVLLLHRKKFTE